MYTPVRAAAAGVVQEAGQPYMSYGDTAGIIMIAHASNFSTLYAHLDVTAHPPIVKAGQRVAANEIIGFVGVTGWTTGPHVHFMTLYNQRQVDPLRFLP
jgi:murein DD-endopeptidase MepM/ murein hydrolase activator NlpD